MQNNLSALRVLGIFGIGVAGALGAIHLLSMSGRIPLSRASVLLLGVPSLFLAGFGYIIAGRRAIAVARSVSPWAFVGWVLAFAFLALNSSLESKALENANFAVIQAQPVLESHGTIVRTLSPTEARSAQVWVIRGTSGTLLGMLLVPTIGILALTPTVRTYNQRDHVA